MVVKLRLRRRVVLPDYSATFIVEQKFNKSKRFQL